MHSKLTFGRGDGLAEVMYATTEFLLVRREVYLRVAYRLKLPLANERFGAPVMPFFQPLLQPIEDGHWDLAEDFAFSERVRQAGPGWWRTPASGCGTTATTRTAGRTPGWTASGWAPSSYTSPTRCRPLVSGQESIDRVAPTGSVWEKDPVYGRPDGCAKRKSRAHVVAVLWRSNPFGPRIATMHPR